MNGSKGVKHKLSPTAMWGFFVGEFGVARGRVRCVGAGVVRGVGAVRGGSECCARRERVRGGSECDAWGSECGARERVRGVGERESRVCGVM